MRGVGFLKKPIFWMVLGLALIWTAIWQLPDNKLHLVFCDVGQGDAILISYRSNQVLIDGGPNNKILNCLAKNMPFWDRKIEIVVLTHPQADHFSGLVEVMKRYDVVQFVVNSIVNDSASFWEFHKVALAEEAEIYSPKAGDKIRLGPIHFLVLWPKEKLGNKEVWKKDVLAHFSARDGPAAGWSARQKVFGAATYSSNLNDTSIVFKLSFGKFDALLAGDISAKIESQLDLSANRRIEVLKVAHHGSKYSTEEEFLKLTQPELAVISVGKNSHGHPTEEVIKRLSNQAIKLLRTDQEGEIEIVSDSKNWYTKSR